MRTGPVIAAVLILGTGALAWQWARTPPPAPGPGGAAAPFGKRGPGRGGPGATTEAVPITAATVLEQTVPVYREGIGTVQALNTVTVRSQVDGRLMSVEFVEGQMVAKGDLLARIDPVTYQAQYDQAVAKKAQDEATLANARLDLVRYQKLAQTNAGPKQQADQQAALVAQLEAQVKSDVAAISNAKAVLDYTNIVSPLDGRTGLRLVDPGNIVKAADSTGIVTLTQIKPIALVFTLPQRDLAAVNTALARSAATVAKTAPDGAPGTVPGGVTASVPLSVPVEVLDTDGRAVLARGTLQTVDNQIDVSTGTIKLKAIFPNEDLKLWPGQFVSARVVVDTIADARVVPTAAVRRGPQGTFVYVVGSDLKATVRPVSVRMQDSQFSVLADGVAAGERVVTIGFAQLSEGKLVNITTAPTPGMPSPASSPPGAADGTRKKGDGAGKRGPPGGEATGERRRRRDGSGSGSGADKPG